MNINHNDRMQLVSTSNLKLASKLNKPIAINDITNGHKPASMSLEKATRGVNVIVSYKNDIYELYKKTR